MTARAAVRREAHPAELTDFLARVQAEALAALATPPDPADALAAAEFGELDHDAGEVEAMAEFYAAPPGDDAQGGVDPVRDGLLALAGQHLGPPPGALREPEPEARAALHSGLPGGLASPLALPAGARR